MFTKSQVCGTICAAGPLAGPFTAELIADFSGPIFKGREKRFRARKAECYGYRENGKVVSYFWISEGPQRVALWRGVGLIVPDEVIYIWDCRTAESHRNQGYFSRAIDDARRLSKDRSYWIACEDDNASVGPISRSFKSIRRYNLEQSKLWRLAFHRVQGSPGRTVVE
ncbi:MAG: GNAT family N-acetyltransferase [Rhodospirillaceae bacterium]|jgi:hypothetical protein|nr:GNAT family N-acetyltransferase [Rhodospirillaceae bacterium]MBT6311452.1 GNAT family N-acetyltransferase [Rhodospirillaceae bacterium]MBT7363830.1 GNAT family N-acetyltransferase [Rhodospirillaceae bacterium]